MYLIYLIFGEKELTDHNKAFMLKKIKPKTPTKEPVQWHWRAMFTGGTLYCLLMLHLRWNEYLKVKKLFAFTDLKLFFLFSFSFFKVYIRTLASSEAWNSCRPAETLVIACIGPQRSWFLHTESQNHKIANWRTCWLAASCRVPLIRTTDWKNKCDRLR